MPRQPSSPANRYCSICKIEFCRPHELKRHFEMTLIHNANARQHPCPICGKKFTQKSNITEHTRVAHGPLRKRKNAKSSEGTLRRRRKEGAADKGKGKHPARKNVRDGPLQLGASPSPKSPPVPTVATPAPITPRVSVFSAKSPVTFQGFRPMSGNTGHGISNFKEGTLFFDYSKNSFNTSPMVGPAFSSSQSDFTPSGPLSSFPAMNSFFPSHDVGETSQLEEDVRMYFASRGLGLVPAFPNSSSTNAGGPSNLAQTSSCLPQTSFVPEIPYHPTQQSSSTSLYDDELLFFWRDAIEGHRQSYQQQQHQHQHQHQQYRQPYGLGNNYLTPQSGIIQSQQPQLQLQQQQQQYQQGQWSSNSFNHLTYPSMGAPY